MSLSLEFWYDFSSPFAYLASTQIDKVAERTGATLQWKPLLLGALFRNVGTPNVPLMAMHETKRQYLARDMMYWASQWEVPFRFTSRFPMRTVTALRLAIAAGDRIGDLSHALYKALWVDDRDINDDTELRDILTSTGFDADAMMDATAAAKPVLFENTTRAEKMGIFGVPTCVVHQPEGPLMFWGQDRLAMVEKALTGWRPKYG